VELNSLRDFLPDIFERFMLYLLDVDG